MRKDKKIFMIIFISIFILMGSVYFISGDDGYVETNYTADEVLDILNSNDNIIIKRTIFSFNTKYKVIVNNEIIATVEGKYIKTLGDVFSLISSNGELIAYEKEEVFHFNRQAQFYDAKDNKDGRLESKYLSLGYSFKFYDKDDYEIGHSQDALSLMKEINIYDINDNCIYTINKIDLIKNKYKITCLSDDSNLEKTKIIFLTCIEDVISESDSNNSSSNRN